MNIFFAILFFACSESPDVKDSGTDPVEQPDTRPRDLVMEFDDVDGQPDLKLLSPIFEIPQFSDVEQCSYFVYDGPEIGFYQGVSYQQPDYGHHAMIFFGEPEAVGDLDSFGNSCEKAMDYLWFPAVELNVDLGPGIGMSVYPEDMAYLLKPGTPIMFQSHHVNYSEFPILVQDRFDMFMKPLEQVENYAAPLEVGDDYFEIPASTESYSHTFDCPIWQDMNIAWISGHMHDYGLRETIELIHDGESTLLYEVDPWLDEYYFLSPIEDFMPGGVEVKRGDKIRITCTWENDTDQPIVWPIEMCYSMGIAYPLEEAVICNP